MGALGTRFRKGTGKILRLPKRICKNTHSNVTVISDAQDKVNNCNIVWWVLSAHHIGDMLKHVPIEYSA